jgi:hypothetical protein
LRRGELETLASPNSSGDGRGIAFLKKNKQPGKGCLWERFLICHPKNKIFKSIVKLVSYSLLLKAALP